jgi:hypothetical protein
MACLGRLIGSKDECKGRKEERRAFSEGREGASACEEGERMHCGDTPGSMLVVEESEKTLQRRGQARGAQGIGDEEGDKHSRGRLARRRSGRVGDEGNEGWQEGRERGVTALGSDKGTKEGQEARDTLRGETRRHLQVEGKSSDEAGKARRLWREEPAMAMEQCAHKAQGEAPQGGSASSGCFKKAQC